MKGISYICTFVYDSQKVRYREEFRRDDVSPSSDDDEDDEDAQNKTGNGADISISVSASQLPAKSWRSMAPFQLDI